MSKEQPLILVVYMDRHIMSNEDYMEIITKAMKQALDEKGANTVTFYVPTDGMERIECINPVLATEEQMVKIDKLIRDVENTFHLKHDLTGGDYEDYEGSAVKPFKTDES